MKHLIFKAIKTVLFLTFTAVIIVLLSFIGLKIHVYRDLSDYQTFSETHNTVIVIDPGHGGEDGGAEANGVIEKNVNLAISHVLSDLLKLSDTSVVMTRNDDRLLYRDGEENHKKRHDLLNRVAVAEKYETALFVSIHQNKFEIPKYKGLQVYFSPNNPESERLAKIIQSNTREHLDNSNKREVKQADYRIKVLDLLKMPAVLIECGFLSNPEEAKLLASYEYQKKLAFMTYLSLTEYLNNGEIK